MNKEKLLELKVQMDIAGRIADFISEAKKDFEESIALEIQTLKQAAEKIDSIKKEIEPEALEEFNKTHQKKLLGGIGIQERKYVEMDVAKVREWCFEKQMFLEVDMKGFEKAAPSLNLPFAVEKKEPKVTFPKEIVIE